MKITKRIEVLLVPLLMGVLNGCQSGLYKISTSEDGKELDSKMNYSEVPVLNTEVEFDSSQMPVMVSQ